MSETTMIERLERANDVAQENLRRNRDGRHPPTELGSEARNYPCALKLALSLWLEELGPALHMPQRESCLFQTYSNVEEYTPAIHSRMNSIAVLDTLVAAEERLANRVMPSPRRKVQLWLKFCEREDDPLIDVEDSFVDIAARLKDWQLIWADARSQRSWDETHGARMVLSLLLRGVSEGLQHQADILNWDGAHEEEWLELEVYRLMKVEEDRQQERGQDESRKRKKAASTGAHGNQDELVTCKDLLMAQRKGFVTGVQEYHSALTAAATPESVDLSVEDLTDMRAEIRSACESLQEEVLALQSRKAMVLEEENLKLNGEVQRWQRLHSEVTARMTQFEAAAAAAQLRFEDEKGQLEAEALARLDVEKAQVAAETRKDAQLCQICLDGPRNAVILPCLHGQFCEECLEKYRKTGNTCPACRGAIRGTIAPYIA